MPHEAMVLASAARPPDKCGWKTGARLTLPGTNMATREFLADLGSFLGPLNLSADTMGNLEIVLAELLNNIVEHAYADRSDGRIDVTVDLFNACLTATVVDFGRAMPESRIPRKSAADLDVTREDLPEGGFGWYLIHELVDVLSYTRKGDRNTVRFSMKID